MIIDEYDHAHHVRMFIKMFIKIEYLLKYQLLYLYAVGMCTKKPKLLI